jgi:ABC-2 type transport system ATP-binding protein
MSLVADLVDVEAHGEGWLRYYTSDPEDVNPVVLQTLSSQGIGVVTLSRVPRSLEDVYLRVVEE